MNDKIVNNFPKFDYKRNIVRFGIIIYSLFFFAACGVVQKHIDEVPTEKMFFDGWNLVWSDEFNSVDSGIDEQKWSFDLGGHGFGNRELQYYTDIRDNAFVANGKLVIVASKELYQNKEFTSARITTKGKGDWLYGKFEFRAKLPFGQGIWPAIWLLPTDNEYGEWPGSGEIDIVELVGHFPNRVHGTIHYGYPYKFTGDSFSLKDEEIFADDFHKFTLIWEADKIRWYVDDKLYQTQSKWVASDPNGSARAPFNRRFHIILNVAVGGNWPGSPDETTVFPQQMFVDYVRVYQKETH